MGETGGRLVRGSPGQMLCRGAPTSVMSHWDQGVEISLGQIHGRHSCVVVALVKEMV